MLSAGINPNGTVSQFAPIQPPGFESEPPFEAYADTLPAGNLTAEKMWTDHTNMKKTMWGDTMNYNWAMAGFQLGSNIASMFANYFIMDRRLEAMENIEDRKADAAENISGDQRAVYEKALTIQGESHNRLYGPGGVARYNIEVGAALKDRMHEREVESRERVASMERLDDAFGFPRSEYDYGLPV